MGIRNIEILKVALPTPVRKLFDYLPVVSPENIVPKPGMRVLVPFGSQEKIGIIIEIVTNSDHPKHKLKPVTAYLDQSSLFPASILQLIKWASDYYQTSIGLVFDSALPTRLRKKEKPNEKFPEKSRRKLLVSKNAQTITNSDVSELALNNHQQEAVASMVNHLGQFKVFLLDGVTGSGKTEVYCRVVEAVLKQSKQALILVPEIGLTPQLFERFQSRFQVPIALLHSGVTEKKRYLAWESARTGEASIVIGTRLSSFTPLKNPGVFIIDEEHDPSFKQQEGFHYHARDLMIMRASLENCPIILGSATPSLETLHNVNKERFQSLRLPNRAGSSQSPTVQVIDIRHKQLEAGLSMQLVSEMKAHIENQGQVLLFLNRRGFAPVLMCYECGFIAECKQCDAKMTIHYKTQKLKCHHCDSTISLYKNCPACKSEEIHPLGFGTERIETVLHTHFPEQTIIRLDKDTTRKKGTREKALQQITDGQAHILIGTQMIAKGHHFPNVSLVAVVNIDQALFSTDFRSLERLGQLLTQVSGRAGRSEKKGHVILQTFHPHHPLLKMLIEKDYAYFASEMLVDRQSASLPPFSYQVLFRAEAKNSERPGHFLNFIKHLILKENETTMELKTLGPIAAPMERQKGSYRAQLLLQSQKRNELRKILAKCVPLIDAHALSRTVRWSLDIDPIEMF